MNKPNIRTRAAMGAAAFALGAVLTAGPALAQKAEDDGGMSAAPRGLATTQPQTQRGRGLYNSVRQSAAPVSTVRGKAEDDGGLPAEPNAAALRRAPAIRQAPSASQNGKAADDGGLVQ